MTDGYDGNGDYVYADEDNEYNKQQQKRCASGAHNGDHALNQDHHHIVGAGGGSEGILNEKANEYVRDCLTEKSRMERKFPIAERLLDSEIEKVQATGRIPMRELKYADIYREKPMRLSQKVLVPVREHPKFNFVGKLLGPKGNSLRRLQAETLCKMTVLGRGSMRDRNKEEELRNSKDPKYAHLSSDLHVEISTIAPPADAYARIAYAMAELRKYLIPDSNDVIRQEQLRELMDHTGNDGTNLKATTAMASYKRLNAHPSSAAVGGGSNIVPTGIGAGTAITGGINKSQHGQHGGYRAITQHTPNYNKNSNAPKQKVMSILEKARSAMDETYGRGFEEHPTYEQHANYEPYSYAHTSLAVHGPHIAASGHNMATGVGSNTARGQTYDTQMEYDTNEYARRSGGTEYYQHSPGYANTVSTATGGTQGVGVNHNRGHVNR